MQKIFRIVSMVAVGWSTVVRDPLLIGRGIGIICLIIVIWGLWSHSPKRRILMYIIITIGAWCLVIGSMFLYQRRYKQGKSLGSGPWQGEIIVMDVRSDDVMIVRAQGREYRYRTEKLFPMGTRLWIAGRVQDEIPDVRDAEYHMPAFITGKMDWPQRLRMSGLHGTIVPDQVVHLGFDQVSWFLYLKTRLIDRIGLLFDGAERALLLGMLIGDRSGFDKQTYGNFIHSGLVHIVAVSGGNLVMITVFLSLLFFWIPLRIRTVIGGIAIVLYAGIVGMDSSIFRAVIMALLMMVALLTGRQSDVRRLMGIASLLMLWRNPYFLMHDIGFVFSFAALMGIVLIRPRIMQSHQQARRYSWRQRIPLLVWKDYVLPTTAATIAVLPFLLLFTGSRNLFSIVTNLFVLPIVPIVMIGGGVAAGLQPWFGETWLSQAVGYLLRYIIRVSDYVATHGPMITIQERWFVGFLVIVIVVYGYCMRKVGKQKSLQQ